MAGSLVKWWKHKILGGYKQFSVQECTTDSEELMYHQVRASSSCSAPPDLLLVSDRENNIPLRSPVVNIIAAAASTTAPPTTTTSPSSAINACHITSATNNNQQRHNQKLQYHHHQHQQQQQTQNHQVTAQQLSLVYNNGAKDIIGSSNGTGSGGTGGKHQKQSGISNSNKQHGQLQPTQDIQPTSTVSHDIVEGQMETQQTSNHASTKHHQQQQNQPQQQQHHHHNHHQQQQHQRPEEHIRLEEFTCDVSVEGGKSSQPLQFSFTFYDLDGHHGKITKDDIVGIVYTIYESIGKSVVVPHSGSKTINVRLTVSPEGKSKSTKNKKTLDQSLNTHQKAQHTALASNTQATTTRRLHRYRPRKLIKSDEEDDDSNSDKERIENLSHVLNQKTATKTQKLNKLKAEQNCCTQQQNQIQHPIQTDLPNSPLDNNIYDNLKANSPSEACRECLAAADETHNSSISPLVSAATTTTPSQFPVASKTTNTTNEAYMKHVASTRIKMLRKSRKQKHQDCLETRQRSLSVGNETCWKNRHLQTKQPNHQQLLWQAEHQLNHSVGGGDVVDGVQLRNPLKNGKTMMAAQKRNSAECWKTALNRNDLISIIRESMEKNRLCFQLNGKPQANVSPIRQQSTNLKQQSQTHKHQQQIANSSSNNNNKHSQQQHQVFSVTCAQRQRSNTVSKIPTLIANHNNAAHHSVSPQHHQRSSSCANSTSNNNNNNSQQHDTNVHEHQNNTNSSISSNNIYHHHLQPHIPIYHQQMAINPAVIAAQNALLTASTSGNVVGSLAGHHGKMNLCGYDSFLHATICGGGLSHSPPPPPPPQALTNHTSLNTQITSPSPSNISGLHPQHQQIATVQPIMSNNTQHTSKRLSLAMTPNQIKTSKILHSGSYINQIQSTADTQQQQQQHHLNSNTKPNSPQYHGYQRLPSTSKHNLSALHLLSPNAEKRSLSELNKWRKDQGKNYDQLLYDKLSEKLQQTNLVASNNSQHSRESNQKRKQRLIRQRRANALVQETNNVSLAATVLTNTICSKENTDYATMLPIVGDPVECENLLGQTSDEETHSQHETTHLKAKEDMTNCKQQPQQLRHVAEGTLVDLDDINEATTPLENAQHTEVNVDALLRVEDEAEVHNPHNLVDDLEIDEDLEEELDEELEELADVAESGRNSANSNNGSNTGAAATLVNTNGANTTSTSINSSSLIHRYVHEHIHHHYHHFEEKEE